MPNRIAQDGDDAPSTACANAMHLGVGWHAKCVSERFTEPSAKRNARVRRAATTVFARGMEDASATKDGRAVIVPCVISGSAGMLARASVMQRPLARGTEGVTMWAGASVWIRSQVSGAKNARRAALALNVKARANQDTRAVDTVGATGMDNVNVIQDGRESTVITAHQVLMESIAVFSAQASTRAAVTAAVHLRASAYARRGGQGSTVVIVQHSGQGPTAMSAWKTSLMRRMMSVALSGILRREWLWLAIARIDPRALEDVQEDG